jgi:hypothetical protein
MYVLMEILYELSSKFGPRSGLETYSAVTLRLVLSALLRLKNSAVTDVRRLKLVGYTREDQIKSNQNKSNQNKSNQPRQDKKREEKRRSKSDVSKSNQIRLDQTKSDQIR